MDEKLCLAIATFNRSQEVIQLLRWVGTLEDQPDEVIVVDQTANHPPMVESYLQEHSRLGHFRWIRLDSPNLPTARNVAALNCSSDLIVFVDDDTIFPDGFVSQYRKAFEDQGLHAIAGGVIGLDGFRSRSLGLSEYRDSLKTLMPQFKPWVCTFLESVCGCNMAVRKSVMSAVGGFDKKFIGPAMYEDKDFMGRVQAAGFRCEYRPEITLVHYQAPEGGCRINRAPYFNEFEKASPFWRYSLKFFSVRSFLRMSWTVLRSICFRKENVLKTPWLIPASIASALFALVTSYRAVNAR